MGKGFFRENARLIESVLQLLDLLFVLCAMLVANYLREGTFLLTTDQLLIVVSTMFGVHAVFSMTGSYRRWRGETISAEITALAINFAIVLLLLGIFFFLSKTGQVYSRLWIAYGFSLSFLATAGLRVIIRSLANWRRRRGYNTRNVLIVGADELGQRVVKNLEKNSWAGIQVVGFVDDAFAKGDEPMKGIKVLGDFKSTSSIVEQYRKSGDPIDYVWIALPSSLKEQSESTVECLLDSTVNISLVPDYFDMQLMKARIDTVADIPLVNFSSTNIYGFNSITKKVFDIVLASIILVLASPVLLLIAGLIKLDSKGPVLFVQRRYGLDGREISIYKFRSMTVMEDGERITQAKKEDVRVTQVGKFLRKTSLDELPQFINVLEGKMSIVGPRPHAVAHNEFYRKRIKGYMTRHVILPGITGLAQVNGCRGETETESKMSKRVEYDLSYINRWSLALDFKIILMTLREVVVPKNVY